MNRLDAEVAVLSSVMLGEKTAIRVFAFLEPRHFSCEAHQTIFEAMEALHEAKKPTDVIHVAKWLKKRSRVHEVGGMEYLAAVLNRAPSGTRVVACARALQEYWRHP